MVPTPKAKAPLALGIISIISGLFSPIVGLVTGIIGLIQGNKGNSSTEHNYKTEIILNGIGIGISVVNFILGIIVRLNA